MPDNQRKALFHVRARTLRVAIVLATVILYALAFVGLYPIAGRGIAALCGVTVVAAAWLLGLRAGLLAVVLLFALNTLLFNLVGMPGLDTVFQNGGGPGTIVSVLVAVVVGRLRDLGQQLERQITDRKRAEEELQTINNRLEQRVAERTEEFLEQVRRTEQILQTTMDGYMLADIDGDLMDVNSAYCEMAAYSRQELLSMNIRDLEATFTENKLLRCCHTMNFLKSFNG